jgi:hypothetical protein
MYKFFKPKRNEKRGISFLISVNETVADTKKGKNRNEGNVKFSQLKLKIHTKFDLEILCQPFKKILFRDKQIQSF